MAYAIHNRSAELLRFGVDVAENRLEEIAIAKFTIVKFHTVELCADEQTVNEGALVEGESKQVSFGERYVFKRHALNFAISQRSWGEINVADVFAGAQVLGEFLALE